MDLIQRLIDNWNQVPGAVLNHATVRDEIMALVPHAPGYPTTIQKMILYICQQLKIIETDQPLKWRESIDINFPPTLGQIYWLAVHGIPRRSIAYAMTSRTNYPIIAGQINREQHAQIYDHFIKLMFVEFAALSPFHVGAELLTIYHPGPPGQLRFHNQPLVWSAMEHALLDDGLEICSYRPERHDIVYEHEDYDFDLDALLLYRSIEGGGPRLSRAIPKRLRDLMSDGLLSEKAAWLGKDLNAWVENKLEYKKGDAIGELLLIRRKIAEIVQTRDIPRMLAEPRPVARVAKMV